MAESYAAWLDRIVAEALARGEFDRLGMAKVVPWRAVVKERRP